jgi:site-specific DNA-methyltransferase (adenine-specific)
LGGYRFDAELDTGIAMNLMLGDCLERMKEIPDGSVDMILADPPYGTTACKWDSVIDLPLMWEQLKRIIKPNGAIVLFGGEPFSSALRMSNIKQYKYDWIWDKVKTGNPLNAKIMPLNRTENISVFINGKNFYHPIKTPRDKPKSSGNVAKGSTKCFNGVKQENRVYTDKYPTNLLTFSNASQKGKLHPTQKPVALMEYLIKTYTQEGETVLDFVMGSGTTGLAAKNLNRKFIGIEKDAGYFEIAKQRLCV